MLQTANRLANMPGPFEVGRREFRRGFNGNGGVRRGDSPNFPPLSVHDDGRQIVLEWDIPGVPREDLDLTLANGQLQICGRRARPQRVAACRYDDRRYGEFQRTVRLNETIAPDSIAATLEGGVLSVRLFRKPRAQPQRVDVKYHSGTS